MLVALVLAAALAQDAPVDAPRRVRGLANGRLGLLRRVISDPELVKAITAKNKVAESPAAVKKHDEEWQANPDLPLRKQTVGNDCAGRLRSIVGDDTVVSEAYLMDNRGTLVCSIGDLPDYWQGDEPNFQRTFGQSQFLYVGDPAPDPAAPPGAWNVSLSMVVLDGPTKVGAATLVLRVPPEMLAPAPAAEPPPATTAPAAPSPTPTPSRSR